MSGHHEPVGERQGRQPAQDARSAACPYCGEPKAAHEFVSPTTCILGSTKGYLPEPSAATQAPDCPCPAPFKDVAYCDDCPHRTESAAQDRAYLSEDGLYRYSLTREIADPHFGCLDEDERDATVTFVGLNPSTADATQDDPTIRRCIRFAREWGFARMKMVNLYAYRATDPASLFVAEEAGMDVVGPENDHVISLVFGGSDKIVAAWGATAPDERVSEFIETFGGWQMWALGLTRGGRPRHPLYMRADVVPFVYEVRSAA